MTSESHRQRLVERMRYERDHRIDHSLFYWTQVLMSFNSNHMEGSTLSAEQTAQIYESGEFLSHDGGERIRIDDAVETANHFEAFNYILDHADDPVDKRLVCDLHAILKRGTSDARASWKNVGGYKTRDNEITQMLGVNTGVTAPAAMVADFMDEVYEACARLDDDPVRIARCHWMFEKIHPFSDGNGRIGRLIMVKECLRLDTIPPLIRDEHRSQYVQGLDRFPEEPVWLVDLLLAERDAYRQQFIEHMAKDRIQYTYHDDWEPSAYESDLSAATDFKLRISQAGDGEAHGVDDLVFGVYGEATGRDETRNRYRPFRFGPAPAPHRAPSAGT